MAEEESKKVDENSTEETSENETKTEDSTASQDEASDTKQSNAKSTGKAKSPLKTTKGKNQDKKKVVEEDDESSDDEELVGILDAPLVVEGKRARKSTEFLSNTINTPQSVERKKIEIPEGKGETLGSMPRVQFQLSKIPGEELKPLHRILFGRPGNASEVKRNIRLFNGFDIQKNSKEYKKKEEQVDRFTQDSMKRLCEILDLEKKGKKEEVLERVMDFLLCPQASGKPVPEPSKKGSGSKKSDLQVNPLEDQEHTRSQSLFNTAAAKKRKRATTPKNEKSKSKKAKSDETVESDGDSEEDEEKEEPPEKKGKSPKKDKKQVKKPAKKEKKEKKEKKVVSIKISPGKKAKKAKEKKADSGDSSDEEPLSKKAKKLPPTNDEILELVKELLDGADLEKITMKSVCKQVYDRFPDFDLTDRKEFIKDSVKEIIT